jgi:UDP-N-acetyl-D-mannosaminuronate dehydrogenase
MPEHVVYTVADALNTQCKPIKRSKILILGLAYEPNVDDERESPSYVLMKLTAERRSVGGWSSSQPVITRNLPEGNPSRGTGQRLRILISFSSRRTIRQ